MFFVKTLRAVLILACDNSFMKFSLCTVTMSSQILISPHAITSPPSRSTATTFTCPPLGLVAIIIELPLAVVTCNSSCAPIIRRHGQEGGVLLTRFDAQGPATYETRGAEDNVDYRAGVKYPVEALL